MLLAFVETFVFLVYTQFMYGVFHPVGECLPLAVCIDSNRVRRSGGRGMRGGKRDTCPG